MHLEALKLEQKKIFEKLNKFPVVSGLKQFGNIKIASVSEISAMKAYVLNYRGTFKDYVDLYFILKEKHLTLKEIGKLAEKKYGNDFNFRLFLEQLVYLKGLRKEKIDFFKEKIDETKMQSFFEKEIKKIKL